MTRGQKPATGRPCVTCGVPHEYNATTGWRADNGHGQHPYLQADAYPPLKSVPTQLTDPTPDDYEVLFGQWAFCRRCGGSTSNSAAGMASHRALHDEIERLRADVDRLLRRGGGGAA